MHSKKMKAFSHQLKADEKLLRKMSTAEKGRKVNLDDLHNMYKEAQDGIFEGAEYLHADSKFVGLQSHLRDVFSQINTLNDIKKSSEIGLTSAVLSTVSAPAELFALPVTATATVIKNLIDRAFIRDVRLGKELAGMFEDTKQSHMDLQNQLLDMMEEHGEPYEGAIFDMKEEIQNTENMTFEDFVKEITKDKNKIKNAFIRKQSSRGAALGSALINSQINQN